MLSLRASLQTEWHASKATVNYIYLDIKFKVARFDIFNADALSGKRSPDCASLHPG
jgi:hypothetical protein